MNIHVDETDIPEEDEFDSLVQSLDLVKSQEIARIKASMFAIQDESFEFDGNMYASDERSRALITGALVLAQLAPDDWSIVWEGVVHDKRSFIGMAFALGKHVAAAYNNYILTKTAINKATTVQAINKLVST